MCQHYWMIEEANGPTSKAKCKKCGKPDEFSNYFQIGKTDYMTMMQIRTNIFIPGLKKRRMVVPARI